MLNEVSELDVWFWEANDSESCSPTTVVLDSNAEKQQNTNAVYQYRDYEVNLDRAFFDPIEHKGLSSAFLPPLQPKPRTKKVERDLEEQESFVSLAGTVASPSDASEMDQIELVEYVSSSEKAELKEVRPKSHILKSANDTKRTNERPILKTSVKSESTTKAKVGKKSQRRSTRTGCARWTQAEEIILEGVTTDCNMLCGGAAPWETIEEYYNHAIQCFYGRHRKLIQAKLPKRSACGLRKHYRIMHQKTNDTKNLPSDFWYNLYHFRWMSEMFNRNQQLVSYKQFTQLKQ